MKFKKIIFFIGPPASGKDTQAKLLAKKFRFKYVVTSKLLKDFFSQKKFITINNKRYDLKKEQNKMIGGGLISSDIAVYIVLKKIKEVFKSKTNRGIIFSGSPRTLKEAKIELDFLQKNFYSQFIFLFLYINYKEVYLRSLKRGRKDDIPKIVKKRIKFYKANTLPAINYLKNNGVLVKINALGSVEEVFRRILGIFAC